MSESIWKKEIRLRKRPEPLPPLPAHLLERSRMRAERPKGTVTIPVVPAGDSLKRVERWAAPAAVEPPAERPTVALPKPEFPKPAFLNAVAGEGQDPIPLLPARAPAADPAPQAPELPAPASTYGWQQPPVETPAQAPEPAAHEEVVAEPEPEAELVPEPEPAPDPEPAAVTAPAEKVPLLKREVSFRRKPKAVAASVPAEVAAPTVLAEAKKPLLKRELSLKRKPKTEKEPKAAKPPKAEKRPKPEKQPKVKKEKAPKGDRGSALKRELHLPRPSRKPKAAPGHKVERMVGLHIGSSQLAAAHVQNNGHVEVLQLARTPIERGLVVAGEVRDSEALTRALKEFFAANKLPRKDVRLGIASTRIGVRVLDVPAVDDPKQFENAIRFRAQELLPIPVTDAILDHVVLGDHQSDEGDVMRRVLLVFAHRDLVNRFVDACRSAGVRLAGIDLDAFALLRAVGVPTGDGNTGRAVVAVAVGNERTVLAVSDGKICDFTRVLEWGGSALDVALARALDLTPSQAEPIKLALSLDATTPPAGLTAVQLEAAKAALRAEIGVLGRELVSSLRFYQSRPDSHAIGEVLLAGGTAALGGLADELQRLLGAPVRLVDPFENVTLGKKVQLPETPSAMAVTVGLGIEA